MSVCFFVCLFQVDERDEKLGVEHVESCNRNCACDEPREHFHLESSVFFCSWRYSKLLFAACRGWKARATHRCWHGKCSVLDVTTFRAFSLTVTGFTLELYYQVVKLYCLRLTLTFWTLSFESLFAVGGTEYEEHVSRVWDARTERVVFFVVVVVCFFVVVVVVFPCLHKQARHYCSALRKVCKWN